MPNYPVVNIVVDVESGTLAPDTREDGTVIGLTPQAREDYLLKAGQAVAEFAEKGIPTIWIKLFPRQSPPLSPAELQDEQSIDEAIGRTPDSATFRKNGFDAFADGININGASLYEYLENLGARHLTVMGGNADVCVLATAIGGVRNGYRTTILSDMLIGRNNLNGENSINETKIKDTLAKILTEPDALRTDNHPLKDMAASLNEKERRA